MIPIEQGSVVSGFHSRRAQLYHLAMAVCPNARQAELEPFLERLPRSSAELSIADLACGDGYLTKFLARTFPHYTLAGIETSDELLVSLRQRNVAECVHTLQLASIPIESDRFDCVVSIAAMHHIVHQKRVFQEVWRVLRPGGTFIIADVNDDTPVQAFFDDVVAQHCITGHDFDFLDGPFIRHLGGKTGFRVVASDIVETPWRFPDRATGVAFVRDLFGLKIEPAALERRLAARLKCEEHDGTFTIDWQLGYHVLRKEVPGTNTKP